MKNYIIPTTVVDDFFDNPQWVREFALLQEFKPDPESMWPGKRTELLETIHKPLFDHTINRALSMFYDIHDPANAIEWHANASFQLVNAIHNTGWIHKDLDKITGIIYLNPDANPSGGTTIWEAKEEATVLKNHDQKKATFKNVELSNELDSYRQENNDQFIESITVKNKFNRLVMFDGNLYHAADEYFGQGDDTRLTLVFFIDGLFAKDYPLQRLKKV